MGVFLSLCVQACPLFLFYPPPTPPGFLVVHPESFRVSAHRCCCPSCRVINLKGSVWRDKSRESGGKALTTQKKGDGGA